MPSKTNEIEKKVIEVLADKSCIEPERISLRSNLIEDLGMDSLDAVETVFAFEEHYGIEIPDDVIREFRIVEDIVSYLLKRFGSNER